MDEFYTSLALLSACVALVMGIIYLILAMKKYDQTYMLFAMMGISLFVFFLIPPAGFILVDSPSYPANILFKRIFIFLYYALIPWFILHYSGYPQKMLAYLASLLTLIGYLLMLFTRSYSDKLVWSIIVMLAFGSILLLGIQAARWQYRSGQKQNAYWLGTTMGVYGLLFPLTAINQWFTPALTTNLLLPMHLHAIFFMLLMGYRLVSSLLDKYKMETDLQTRDAQLEFLMVNAPFIVTQLDCEGKIKFINESGIKALGYQDASQLLHADWFESFSNPADVAYLRKVYHQLVKGGINIPSINTTLRLKNGKDMVISWVNFLITPVRGEAEAVMSIGLDRTAEEKANQLVEKLKSELVMERIAFKEDESFIADKAIVGKSEALKYTILKAKQVANTHAAVLLEGETGVGKELFANLIHKNSSQADMPFIKVNCGALPKELIEDELFGHEKGAFTSALQMRKGRFELAHGGTIFLDEIGELPLDMQPKLLRVLQSGEFERIGGQKTITVDVRLIAATNRNLSNEVKKGNFRADLYYRLNVFPITIPPLRNRKDDLPLLINYFIKTHCQKYERELDQISRANLQRLMSYDWPGNIRELGNVIERSVIVSAGKTLQLDWWPGNGESETGKPYSLEEIEREHILAIMQKCRWKINGENGGAEMLDMHPNTLRSKMKKMGIRRPDASGFEPELEDNLKY